MCSVTIECAYRWHIFSNVSAQYIVDTLLLRANACRWLIFCHVSAPVHSTALEGRCTLIACKKHVGHALLVRALYAKNIFCTAELVCNITQQSAPPFYTLILVYAYTCVYTRCVYTRIYYTHVAYMRIRAHTLGAYIRVYTSCLQECVDKAADV